MKKLLCSLVFIAISLTSLMGQYSGNYTINQNAAYSTSNFTSFKQAIDSLNAKGMNGNVNMSVTQNSGPYFEQVRISSVPGLGSMGDLIIDGNGETIEFSPSFSNAYVVNLDSIENLELKSLVISVKSNAALGSGLTVSNTKNTIISDCKIYAPADSARPKIYGILFDNSTSLALQPTQTDSVSLINNIIDGGYIGVEISGGSTIHSNAFLLQNSEIRNFHHIGIQTSYINNSKIIRNDIHRETNYNKVARAGAAISIFNRSDNNEIGYNRIHDLFGNHNYSNGLYIIFKLINAAGSLGNENFIHNNLIYNIINVGDMLIIHNQSSDYFNVVFNTIIFDNKNNIFADINFYSAISAINNFKIQNNIISIHGGGYRTRRIYSVPLVNSTTIDNNVLHADSVYSPSALIYGRRGSINYTSFSAWQATGSGAYSQNSVIENPYFKISEGKYVPMNHRINNSAIPFSTIDYDLDSNLRNTVNPDPGAFEFDVDSSDLSITKLNTDEIKTCQDLNSEISVSVFNKGYKDMNNFNVWVEVYSGNTLVDIDSIYIDTLRTLSSRTIKIDSISGILGQSVFKVYHDHFNDSYPQDDTLLSDTLFLTEIPTNPIVTDTAICFGDRVELQIQGDSGFTYFWYPSYNGFDTLNAGLTFNLPNLYADTFFYVEGSSFTPGSIYISEVQLGTTDELEIQNTGLNDVNINDWKIVVSNSYTSINSYDPNIQTLRGTLKSAKVLSFTDGNYGNLWGSNLNWDYGSPGWIMIFDHNKKLIDMAIWEWDSISIQTMNISVFGINISIDHHQWKGDGISLNPSSGKSISRIGMTDNNIKSDFDTIVSTIGSKNLGLGNNFQGNISGCLSKRFRSNVKLFSDSIFEMAYLNTGKASYDFTIKRGSATYNYVWFFGDGNSSISQNPSHTYQVNGTYQVGLTQYGTCDTSTVYDTISVFTIGNGLVADDRKISVHPNPAKNKTFIDLGGNISEGTIQILNSHGSIVFMESGIFGNRYELNMDFLKSGLYIIQLNDGYSVTNHKLIVK